MDHDLSFLLDSPKADAESSWVQVAKTGKFSDPRYGNFTITAQDFGRWIKNFDSNVGHGSMGLPVDADHSPEKRGDTEAYGWIKQLEQRGNELWARVEWNDQGKTLIAERRYAYISPSYTNNFKDEHGKEHGSALVGIALTNRPFLQMATVNLSKFTFASSKGGDDQGLDPDETTDLDAADGDPTSSDFDDDDFQNDDGDMECPKGYTDAHALDDVMLNISDASRQKHAVVVKKIGGATRHMFPIPPGDRGHARAALRLLPRAIRAGHITSQEAAAIRSRARSVLGGKSSGTLQHSAYSLDQMQLDQILTAMGLSRETLGVDAEADETTVLAAIKAHTDKTPEGTVTLSQDQVSQLVADAAAGRQAAEELRVNKFEQAFTLAQEAGKVVPAQKDTFKTIYDQTPETAIKLLDELQPVLNMTPQGVGATPTDLDAAGRALASEFTDTVTPMGIDTDALRLHAAAVEIERTRKVSYQEALRLAESGVTV